MESAEAVRARFAADLAAMAQLATEQKTMQAHRILAQLESLLAARGDCEVRLEQWTVFLGRRVGTTRTAVARCGALSADALRSQGAELLG